MSLGIKPTVDFVFKKVFGSPENNVALIEFLLNEGMDVNGMPWDKDGPFISAIDYGARDAVRCLLERGANPNRGRMLIAALNSEE